MALFSPALSSPRLFFPKSRPNPSKNQHHHSIFFPRVSVSTTPATPSFDLRSYWTTLISQIDTSLDQAIPIRHPDSIYEAMRYSVLAPGAKRAPPVMCIASACDLFALPRPAALPTACALEMIHAASLIHDDLPSMDDSSRRRGRPSNHAVFGVDMAILAGDALFPLGFQHIVSHTPPNLVPGQRVLRVVAEIARAVGSTGMAAGQLLDLQTDADSLTDFVMEKKFGEMAECSAVCGGILGGAEDEELDRLRRYGRAVGVLYEVMDDILAEKEEEEKEAKKKSYVKVFGMERAMKVAEELREKAKRELQGFESRYGERVLPLYSFVDFAVERGFDVGGGVVAAGDDLH